MNDNPELVNLLGPYFLEIKHYDGDIWIAGPNKAKLQWRLACTNRALHKMVNDMLGQYNVLEGLAICGPTRAEGNIPRWENKAYPGPFRGIIILYRKEGKKLYELKITELTKIIQQLEHDIPNTKLTQEGEGRYRVTRWISQHGLSLRVRYANASTRVKRPWHAISVTLR